MITVPAYIAVRFAQRFFGFFEHWYIGGTRFFWDRLTDILGNFDSTFAVAVTVRHLFQPLYQDNTVIGYILGFIFRVLRTLLGIVIYIFVSSLALIVYFLWVSLPAFVVYKIVEGLIF